jgi:hypothetical protein
LELKDGWRKRKNVTIALIVVIRYSEEQKGVEIVKNRWMWIDDAKELDTLFYLHRSCCHH